MGVGDGKANGGDGRLQSNQAADFRHISRSPTIAELLTKVPLLATHFVREHAQPLQRPVLMLSDEVVSHLQGYAWPGNVRCVLI